MFSRRKRAAPRATSTREPPPESEEAMQTFFGEALVLQSKPVAFDLMNPGERIRLAAACWSKAPPGTEEFALTSANPGLRSILEVVAHNKQQHRRTTSEEIQEERAALATEGMLASLVRMQSQVVMPMLTVRVSLAARRAQIPRDLWHIMHSIAPGLLTSYNWVNEFAAEAMSARPPPEYEELPLVGAVMFDNYTRKVLYSSDHTTDSWGFRLDMTNSCSMAIPRSLAPPGFDAAALCKPLPPASSPTLCHHACSAHLDHTLCSVFSVLTPFGPSLSIDRFTALFSLANAEIENRKSSRFTSFILKAASGTLFTRPTTKPTWVAHLTYHEPMWGVLQSSYEDVETELNQLRQRHLSKRFLFVGGDGLSINRVNHLLNKHPDLYLDSAPFIIPVQGESPHGVYHILHAGWRLYWRFIKECKLHLGNAQVIEDPPVKHFNHSLHFLWRVTRAASEYLVELANDPLATPLDDSSFLTIACRNVDLAWLVHFLRDYAFLVLDFKQAVRSGDSTALDVLWREFFSLGHTSTANKTQYVPMSIMRIFWSRALHPDLQKVYHAIRSIPMSDKPGSLVGWDTPVEWLNGAITEGVASHVSEPRIERFVQIYPLLQSNYTTMRDWSHRGRRAAYNHMKDMTNDVAMLKKLFHDKIGSSWLAATAPNSNSKLITGRGVLPWEEVARVMRQPGNDSVAAFVSSTVKRLTPNYYVWN